MQVQSRQISVKVLLLLAAACSGLAATPDAFAQQVYRHVDKDGKVTFSDQPQPAEVRIAPGAGAGTFSGQSQTRQAGTMVASLPFELRQVVQRFPVTLYTRDDCLPCDTGRALLSSRGIPFSERQIKTPEDNEAFERLSNQDALPLLSIGAQQLKGFSDVTWSQYLDAAGYPKSIQLPGSYRNPPAQPLVSIAPATANSSSPAAPQAITTPLPPIPPAPTGPTPDNPAGIRF